MIEPTRVLHIVTQMNCAGLESRLMDIYRNIDRSNVQFDFYTCRTESGFFDEEIKSLGGKVYYNLPLKMREIHKIACRFKIFLADHEEYKIVHCHLNQWCGLVLKGAKEANVPVRIAHSRTSLQKITAKNLIKNFIKLSTNRYATHCFAVSKKAGEWLFGKRMLNMGKVTIWPNAIDYSKFTYNPEKRSEIREMLSLGNDLTLMHVGNLRPEKNHKFLLQVFKRILEKRSSAKLVLIGKDEMNGTIQSIAIRMGIEQSVMFLGSRSDVAELLQAGDVFVFPSLYEGFPGAVLEAQAAGLLCIISDKITNEVCITPLVKQFSLSMSSEKWAEYILAKAKKTRIDTSDYFERSGFEIRVLAYNLSRFYVENSR